MKSTKAHFIMECSQEFFQGNKVLVTDPLQYTWKKFLIFSTLKKKKIEQSEICLDTYREKS